MEGRDAYFDFGGGGPTIWVVVFIGGGVDSPGGGMG
jgi:hypothetical protein